MHVVFARIQQAPSLSHVKIHEGIEDEIQHRLGGAFQAAVERYHSDREGERQVRQGSEDDADEGEIAQRDTSQSRFRDHHE